MKHSASYSGDIDTETQERYASVQIRNIRRKQSMRNTRILGIAPYEGICTLLRQSAGQMPGIELEAYTGNLDAGVEIARRLGDQFDCIISRGGTANLIRQVTAKPVVEIEFSACDVLQSINLANSCSKKWAIVGFEPITKNAKLLSTLLHYELTICTLERQEDAEGILRNLKAQGCQTVVCDAITDISAKHYGINSILIHSSSDSVMAAIEEAVHICAITARMGEQKQFFEGLLTAVGINTLVFNRNGECVFTSSAFPLPPELSDIIRQQASLDDASRSQTIQKNIKGSIYMVEVRPIHFAQDKYFAFIVACQRGKTTKRAAGIQYYTAKEVNDTFLSDFYIGRNPVLQKYEQLNSSGFPHPLMIFGAPGTGKAQCAAYLHVKGPYWNSTYIDCDFARMREKELGYLLGSINSPVWSNGHTFYFHHLDAMLEEQFSQLLSSLIESGLCRRNKVIFSWVRGKGEGIPRRARTIMDRLSCYTLQLPALRDRADEIPQLAVKYMNAWSADVPKQVLGFCPEALRLMEAYAWPGNLLQFKRVIFQAICQSDAPYISSETIRDVLEQEQGHLIPGADASLPLNGTMQEIKQEVARRVLVQCGNNQSKAAQRLGIGRTTLWRLLGWKK